MSARTHTLTLPSCYTALCTVQLEDNDINSRSDVGALLHLLFLLGERERERGREGGVGGEREREREGGRGRERERERG